MILKTFELYLPKENNNILNINRFEINSICAFDLIHFCLTNHQKNILKYFYHSKVIQYCC